MSFYQLPPNEYSVNVTKHAGREEEASKQIQKSSWCSGLCQLPVPLDHHLHLFFLLFISFPSMSAFPNSHLSSLRHTSVSAENKSRWE